jgi:hypothetical protein
LVIIFLIIHYLESKGTALEVIKEATRQYPRKPQNLRVRKGHLRIEPEAHN